MANHYQFHDPPVLHISENDRIHTSETYEGIFISGSPRSGKSACAGKQLAFGMLKANPTCGALILTAKAEETTNWLRYAEECGRSKDIVLFNEKSGLVFDPIAYEWSRPGRGAGDIENTVDFFTTLISLGQRETGSGHDPFWERGNEELQRNVIKLLDLAGEPISIINIDRCIKSLPTEPGQFEQASWQSESYCAKLIARIKSRKETLTEDQWSDLDFASQYALVKWPNFDARPRSSLEMTWSGMASKFLFSPWSRIFSGGKYSVYPEMTTHESKLIIADFPLLEYGFETARLMQVILKLTFQRAWLRRKLDESPNPVFLWQDEFQYFATRRDNFFQQTCRGSRVSVVCLTQNILNLSEELGEHDPGSKTKSFLGNLAIKIFLQQNEIETAKFAADQIGKTYRYLDSFQTSSGATANSGVGASKHLAHIVDPIEFSLLKKPSATNPHAEAIVYKGGEIFNATKTQANPNGSNYLRVLFSREI